LCKKHLLWYASMSSGTYLKLRNISRRPPDWGSSVFDSPTPCADAHNSCAATYLLRRSSELASDMCSVPARPPKVTSTYLPEALSTRTASDSLWFKVSVGDGCAAHSLAETEVHQGSMQHLLLLLWDGALETHALGTLTHSQ